MSLRINIAIAAALIAGVTAAESFAQTIPEYAAGSTNTILRNFPLPDGFRTDDYGLIVETVFKECQSTRTQMINGPYRRTSNKAATGKGGAAANTGGPEPSDGDARLDYLVAAIGSVPVSGSTVSVTAAQVALQSGVDPNGSGSNGAVVLRAQVSRSGSLLTVTDTTPKDSQVLDAGPNVGGMDAIVVIKNGDPKTIDVICDMNMYYLTPGALAPFEYGVKDFNFGDVTNQLILLWAMGPSGAGSDEAATTACKLFNPPHLTPLRYLSSTLVPGVEEGDYVPPAGLPANCPPPGDALDPGDACVGPLWTREEKTDGQIGNVIRFFGDLEQPANFTACGAFGGYCDPNETIPADGQFSGNACNQNRGLSGAPNINITSTLQGNTGQWLKIGGAWIYVNYR